MKAKELFTIILKIFGIYLIKDVLLAIPPVLKNFYQFVDVDPDVALFSLIFSLVVLGLHFIIVYLLLFKTSFLISKLNLTAGLSEQPLIINIHRSKIYTIAILITGLLILVFSIPTLIKHIYTWYDYNSSIGKNFGASPYNYSGLLISLSEVLIGFLFLGNQRALVNFIEYRSRKTKVDKPD
jgi:hypothetical protein